MCLAIPGQIKQIHDDDPKTGTVSFAGITKDVNLAFVPEANVGDYVIVHVGFAISKVDERAAQETLALIDQLIPSTEQDKGS